MVSASKEAREESCERGKRPKGSLDSSDSKQGGRKSY